MAILNALRLAELPGATKQHLLAALIGGDLGPRLLPTGSLAGLLWLQSLARDGVGLSRFVGIGFVVAVPALALALVILLLAGEPCATIIGRCWPLKSTDPDSSGRKGHGDEQAFVQLCSRRVRWSPHVPAWHRARASLPWSHHARS